MTAPEGLQSGGLALWTSISAEHELDAAQLVQLAEACRAKDRCDLLDSLLAEGHDSALLKDANTTANLMKQLLAALRLPDEYGKKPQYRGARGAQKPSIAGGANVSSMERARARKSS
jgi:hypothetical protein